jgi:plastocyanin
VELANDGDEKHTFTVNEFLVDEELASGEDADVSFTPNEPGEFTFFCRIHPDTMQGTIRVARSREAPGETPTDGGGSGFGY